MHIQTNGTDRPSSWTGEGDWGGHFVGIGGTCADRSPPVGYWCSPKAPRMGNALPTHPVGVRPTTGQLPYLPYANATGAVVHSWRPGHWYTNMYEVGGARVVGGAGAPRHASAQTYTHHRGFLPAGADCDALPPGPMSLAKAEAACSAEPSCAGLTFRANASSPSGVIPRVFFKSRAADAVPADGWQVRRAHMASGHPTLAPAWKPAASHP